MRDGPWRRFDEFIAPGADRCRILESLLDEHGLRYGERCIAGNRHILLGPGPEAPDLEGPPGKTPGGTTLVAHYDRVRGSPGANDNSAAVFLLLETALALYREARQNWLIIFTDKEELGPGGAIRDQGAYTLGRTLRDSGRGGGRFYIFDACGVGDWIIISTMTDYVMRGGEGAGFARIRRRTQQLRDRALSVSRKLNLDRVLLAPVPFSDDLGFLRAGIGAQTITALPSAEANRLASELRNHPGAASALITGGPGASALIPETWKTLNSPADKKDRLTPEHYGQLLRFALALI
ncbi:MAG: M28 family peptidase [Spirochaetaceae bacterium]|jgi:hypothetical protein|nr:M28 family peptidase [Spirochaetaceae bacterium]